MTTRRTAGISAAILVAACAACGDGGDAGDASDVGDDSGCDLDACIAYCREHGGGGNPSGYCSADGACRCTHQIRISTMRAEGTTARNRTMWRHRTTRRRRRMRRTGARTGERRPIVDAGLHRSVPLLSAAVLSADHPDLLAGLGRRVVPDVRRRRRLRRAARGWSGRRPADMDAGRLAGRIGLGRLPVRAGDVVGAGDVQHSRAALRHGPRGRAVRCRVWCDPATCTTRCGAPFEVVSNAVAIP